MSFQRSSSRSLPLVPVSLGRVIKRHVVGSLSICIFTLVLFGGSAWSFEKTGSLFIADEPSKTTHNVSYVQKKSSSSIVDSCLPLLKSSHHAPSKSAMERSQRSAGKMVALSVALGVRYALGPLENPALSHTAYAPPTDRSSLPREMRNLRAIKVAAYRNCRKELALKTQKKKRQGKIAAK